VHAWPASVQMAMRCKKGSSPFHKTDYEHRFNNMEDGNFSDTHDNDVFDNNDGSVDGLNDSNEDDGWRMHDNNGNSIEERDGSDVGNVTDEDNAFELELGNAEFDHVENLHDKGLDYKHDGNNAEDVNVSDICENDEFVNTNQDVNSVEIDGRHGKDDDNNEVLIEDTNSLNKDEDDDMKTSNLYDGNGKESNTFEHGVNDLDPNDFDFTAKHHIEQRNDSYQEGNNIDGCIYAIPLDLECANYENPSPERVRILTNHTPPLHFICNYSRTPWVPTWLDAFKKLASVFPNDGMHFHQGALPFHCACRMGAPRSVLEWWCEQYPEVVSTYTTDTQESPLHCYLFSSTSNNVNKKSYFSAVQFLVEKYPAALHRTNRMGLLPYHVAAMQDADMNVLFYLACRTPEVLTNSPVLSLSG